jgi:hypothetical protein
VETVSTFIVGFKAALTWITLFLGFLAGVASLLAIGVAALFAVSLLMDLLHALSKAWGWFAKDSLFEKDGKS